MISSSLLMELGMLHEFIFRTAAFTDFFYHGESDEPTSVFELPIPMSKKRERGRSSGTPPLADRKKS